MLRHPMAVMPECVGKSMPESRAWRPLALAAPQNGTMSTLMRLASGIGFIRRPCLALWLALMLGPASALSPTTPMDQLIRSQWGEKEGAPSDVWSTVQTADGWVWFGGSHGLVRFDGVTFEHVETEPGAADPSPGVSDLLALDSGELVVGYHDGGAAILRGHVFSNYHAAHGLDRGTVFGIGQDLDRRLWLAARTGLKRFENGRWETIGAQWDVTPGPVEDVATDSTGRLWIMTGQGVQYLERGQRRFQHVASDCSVGGLVRQPDGEIWAWTVAQMDRCSSSSSPSTLRETSNWRHSSIAMFDRDGSLWTADDEALYRVALPDKGTWPAQIFFKRDPRPHESVRSHFVRTLMEDRSGDVWAPNIEEELMFRDRQVMPAAGSSSGESPLLAADMLTDDDGIVWMASMLGTDGRDRQDGVWKYDGHFKQVQPEDIPLASHLFMDAHRSLWAAGGRSLWRLIDGRFVRDLALPSGSNRNFVGAMADDPATGSLWISVRGVGLFLRQGDKWVRNGGIADLPQAEPSVLSLAPDRTLWLGYLDGRVFTLADGKVRQIPIDGTPFLGAISAIDASHRVLVGGMHGLATALGSHLRVLHPAQVSAFDTITSILRTTDGEIWLNDAMGAVSISADGLVDSLIAADTPVAAYALGVEDGYPGRGANMQRMGSTMTQARDGRVWLSGLRGVGWFYPATLPRNATIPLLIRSVTADAVRQPLDAPIHLRSGTSHLTIAYTALNYTHPAQQRFRYRLAGFDRDWTEAGSRREAYYTNLPPGHYRFEVVELHETGKWSEPPVLVDFDIAPAFVQTKVFIALSVLAGALATLLVIRWQVASSTRRESRRLQERMDERIGERERIARELHDTLLQGTQGLILAVHSALTQLRRGGSIERTLESALSAADEAVIESRERIQDLRTITHLRGRLGEALETLGRDLARDTETRFALVVDGERRDLDTTAADEAYQIAREALGNAFHHAGASAIELSLLYEADSFAVRIHDNGRGIDAQALAAGARPGHWGLPGMRERAQRLGARFDIRSQPGAGTVIELTIDSRTAYADQRAPSLWLRRWWPDARRPQDHTIE
jgi:signal transduction histidine kinase/ligand-binding sensor domain-containing protein